MVECGFTILKIENILSNQLKKNIIVIYILFEGFIKTREARKAKRLENARENKEMMECGCCYFLKHGMPY